MSTQPFESHAAGGMGAVVQITLGEVYNEVRSMHDELRTLNSGLQSVMPRLDDHEIRLRAVDPLPKQVTDLEEVVRVLIAKVDGLRLRSAMVVGGGTVLGAAISSVVTVLITHK